MNGAPLLEGSARRVAKALAAAIAMLVALPAGAQSPEPQAAASAPAAAQPAASQSATAAPSTAPAVTLWEAPVPRPGQARAPWTAPPPAGHEKLPWVWGVPPVDAGSVWYLAPGAPPPEPGRAKPKGHEELPWAWGVPAMDAGSVWYLAPGAPDLSEQMPPPEAPAGPPLMKVDEMAPRLTLASPARRTEASTFRRALAVPALAALFALTTGCYSYQPVATGDKRETNEAKGKVLRYHEGPVVREIHVSTLRYPWVSGEVKDEQGVSHPVTMDLRMMKDVELRVVSRGTKAAVIVTGSTILAGALAGAVAGAFSKNSLRLGY